MSKHKKNKHNFQNTASIEQNQDYSQTVSFEEIQKKAYEIYQKKGGSDLDNWLEAEEALRQNKGSNAYAAQSAQAGE